MTDLDHDKPGECKHTQEDLDVKRAHDIAARLTALLKSLNFGSIDFYEQYDLDKLGSRSGHAVWVDERYDPIMIKLHVETAEAPFHFSRDWDANECSEIVDKLTRLDKPSYTDIENALRVST